MTAEPETARTLGYLEGRISEQSAMLQDLKIGQQEINSRLDSGLAEVNRRLDSGLGEVNHRIDTGLGEVNRRLDSGLGEVNRRIDRLLLAIIGIGGGIIAALVGLVITLIVRGV